MPKSQKNSPLKRFTAASFLLIFLSGSFLSMQLVLHAQPSSWLMGIFRLGVLCALLALLLHILAYIRKSLQNQNDEDQDVS